MTTNNATDRPIRERIRQGLTSAHLLLSNRLDAATSSFRSLARSFRRRFGRRVRIPRHDGVSNDDEDLDRLIPYSEIITMTDAARFQTLMNEFMNINDDLARSRACHSLMQMKYQFHNMPTQTRDDILYSRIISALDEYCLKYTTIVNGLDHPDEGYDGDPSNPFEYAPDETLPYQLWQPSANFPYTGYSRPLRFPLYLSQNSLDNELWNARYSMLTYNGLYYTFLIVRNLIHYEHTYDQMKTCYNYWLLFVLFIQYRINMLSTQIEEFFESDRFISVL